MIRSYRYSLTPTHAQERRLDEWLRLTREIYNASIQERRDAWQKQHVSVSAYDQMAQLPAVREARPEFNTIPISVLRGTIRRSDRAFKAFFRRCKSGETPGFPRFKGRGRFESVMIDDIDCKNPLVAGNHRVKVPLLGKVKVRLHRLLEGTPKAMRIKREAGRWYVTFACVDVPAQPLAPTGREVGVDLGLASFIATSDGESVPNERPGGKDALRLARAQRRVSRRRKGSRRRRQAVRSLSRAHAHVANQRRERHILVAKALVARYDRIVVEDLNVKGLAGGMLAKQVNDAAWGSFLHWLRCKAESAGREVVEVDPRGTSQECPECGQVKKKTLAERVHCCDCGYTADRDVAAARVILARGQRVQGDAAPVRARRRSAKPKSLSGPDHTQC